MTDDRMARQIAFMVEMDKLKRILRRTRLVGGDRRETSAEHSWHIAVMAPILAEYSPVPIDVAKVVRMMLAHDIVEIDAGDTFVYDVAANADKEEREQKAADRLFGMLPADQAAEMRALWDEFEARETPEARFAAALDRLQPLLNNYHNEGGAWQQHGIRYEQVIERNRHMAAGAPALWEFTKRFIDESAEKGWLAKPSVDVEGAFDAPR